ncbi:MAG: exonuclease SbcCD subunit D [Caldilineaceae bacterium]|nr:exonuclease SbcCD subunit D [Caldilineaceae bacterium]
MRARFLHLADCHLGYRQYGRNERFNDFSKAFYAVIDVAVAEKVDFVVLAGDLFQKRSIDALTLSHAMRGLEKLQKAGIPCLAVEGNHELAYFNESIGWMRFLAERDLLVLLDTTFESGKPLLEPYTRRNGAYLDVKPGLRVYGLRYYGSATASAVANIGAALDEADNSGIEYTIFIAHTGIEGVLAGEAGGLTHRELAPLRPHIDYLALGHVHKPFDFDGWIYNPGSPETCSMTEAAWPQRGYYLVDVDTQKHREENEPAHSATLHANPRRDFVRLSFKVDAYTSPDALYAACQEYAVREARDRAAKRRTPAAPVVELRLHGVLAFDRAGLDLARYEELLEANFSPLLAFVKNATQPTEFAVAADAQLNRRDLEQQIIADLLGRDARFAGQREGWTRLALSLKQMALTGADPAAILDELTNAAPQEEIERG